LIIECLNPQSGFRLGIFVYHIIILYIQPKTNHTELEKAEKQKTAFAFIGKQRTHIQFFVIKHLII